MRNLKIAALLLGVLATFIFVAPVASATANPGPKVWVCKYVGTPGIDEVLKSGKNPIAVSSNATVGTYFNDAQGRSYVLDTQTENNTGPGNTYSGDLTCPAPEGPTIVTPDVPTVTAPTCTSDGSLVIPTVEGVTYQVEPAYDGPGDYTVTAIADKGFVLSEGDWSWDLTVLPQLTGDQCKVTPPPATPGPANPQAIIATTCGHATFTLSNLTPQTTDESATFVTTINGKDSTQVTVQAGDTQTLGYTPTPNTGTYTIGVKSDGVVLATATLESKCGQGGAPSPKPPTVVEGTAVSNQETLPHTGGGSAIPIAGAGIALLLLGTPLAWWGTRRKGAHE